MKRFLRLTASGPVSPWERRRGARRSRQYAWAARTATAGGARRVLILAPHFPPEAGSAANLLHDLGAALARRGDRVTVVTPMPRYHVLGSGRPYGGLRLRVVERLERMRVIRVATVAVEGWLPARALSEFITAAALAVAALRVERPEVVIVYSPPLPQGLAACFVRLLRGAPFVLNLQDLVPRAMVDLGVLRSPAVIRAYEVIERFVYCQAAHTTVHSAGNLAHVLARGIEAGRASIVPNWVDLPWIDAGTGLGASLRDEWELGDGVVASFAGVIGRSQDLDVVIEAARISRGDPGIAWLIVGDGVARRALGITAQDLPSLRFRPMQSRERYAALLDATDIGLVTLRAEVRSPVVPSKILSLMAARRPVVAALARKGDAARLIQEADCGVVVDPGDAPGLADAVLRLAADPSERVRLGANGRRYVEENLALDVVVRRWDNLLDQVAGQHPVGAER